MSFTSAAGYTGKEFATAARPRARAWSKRGRELKPRVRAMKPASTLSRKNPGLASTNSSNALPPRNTIPALQKTASTCKACDLWKTATQTVFGVGSPKAMIMIVGEQPGDQEDRVGRPFVGPAGKLLNVALDEVGIDRAAVYVTNVVKHFKWSASERGKRRIHKKPNPPSNNCENQGRLRGFDARTHWQAGTAFQ